MSCYLTKIFIHLSVISAVCYFSICKLIGWDPVNIYWFKVSQYFRPVVKIGHKPGKSFGYNKSIALVLMSRFRGVFLRE